MSRTRAVVSGRSDAELIAASRAGDSDAYAELYNRHVDGARAAARALSRSKADTDDVVAEAFSRVLSTLRRGGGPDVSFRPYLLTAVRHSFYDRTRKAKREELSDEPDDIVSLAALDASLSGEDRAMVATAFATLPERWQLVLWHTEVEGMTPAEVAPLVGLAPNAASALAYRAREGLRQAYLQAHLRTNVPDECSDCAPKLGAFVRDGLAARERRRVDEHLANCDPCRKLVAELEEANGHLKAVLIPLLLGVPAAQYLAGLHAGKGLVSLVRHAPKRQQFVGGAVAAAAVAAVATLTLVSLKNHDQAKALGERAKSAAAKNAAGGGVNSPKRTGGLGTDPDSSVVVEVGVDNGSVDPGADSGVGSGVDSNDGSAVGADAGGNLKPSGGSAGAVGGAGVDNGDQLDSSITSPSVASDAPVTTVSDAGGTDGPTTTPAVSTPTPTTTQTTTLATVVVPPATSSPVATVPVTTLKPTVPSPTTTSPADPPATTVKPAQLAGPLSISVQLLGTAEAGGEIAVKVTVRNNDSGGGSGRAGTTASHLRSYLSFPVGVTFAKVDSVSASCAVVVEATKIGCDLPSLPAGAKQSFIFTFALGANAKGHMLVVGSLQADGFGVVYSPSVSIPITPSQDVFATIDSGSVLAIGNSSMTCDAVEMDCAAAQHGTGAVLNRQSFSMVYVNDQPREGVFNSSSAKLELGAASIAKAFLVWGGDVSNSLNKAPDASAKGTVQFTNPVGTLFEVLASKVAALGDGSVYSALSDVSDIVRDAGSGIYSVSNIQSTPGIGSFGGWSLVVVTHNDADPLRLLAVLAPNATVSNSVAYKTGVGLGSDNQPHGLHIVTVAFEGELGLQNESLSVNGEPLTNDANPADNVFNSSVDGAEGTVNVNNFGIDVDNFSTVAQGSAITATAVSDNETARLALIAVALDLH